MCYTDAGGRAGKAVHPTELLERVLDLAEDEDQPREKLWYLQPPVDLCDIEEVADD